MRRRLSRFGRLPLTYWAVVALLAFASIAATNAQLDAATRERARYGTTRRVWVTHSAVVAGAPLSPAELVTRDVPLAFLPNAPLDASAPIESDLVAAVDLPRDTVISAGLVVPGPASRLSLALRQGHVGVGIPIGPEAVPTEPGDIVDLLAPGLAGLSSASADTTDTTHDTGAADASDRPSAPAFAGVVPTVAHRARVLAVEVERVVVEIDQTAAPAVALALDSGAVTLALTPADDAR